MLHSSLLEKKVEFYREKQALMRVMMNDLEQFNKKAEMSKELATYYSPLQPLATFPSSLLNEQPTIERKTKEKVIDVNYAMKIEDTVKIKKLEQELQSLKDVKSQNEVLTEKNRSMKADGKELTRRYKDLQQKARELECALQE